MWLIYRGTGGATTAKPIAVTAFKDRIRPTISAFHALSPSPWSHTYWSSSLHYSDTVDYYVMHALQTNKRKWRNRYEIEVPYSPRENYLRTCGDAGDGD